MKLSREERRHILQRYGTKPADRLTIPVKEWIADRKIVKSARLASLRRALPLCTNSLRERFAVTYGDGDASAAAYKMLMRDLRELGAVRDGASQDAEWRLP